MKLKMNDILPNVNLIFKRRSKMNDEATYVCTIVPYDARMESMYYNSTIVWGY